MAVQTIYLFGHDARDLASRIVRSRKALSIKWAGLLLRELEADIILIDWWTHGIVRATSSSGTTGSKHETGSQLGTTRRSQNLALILVSKSSKSWGGEALREGTAVVALLLAETGVALNLAFVVGDGAILGVLHHDTQVRSVVAHRIAVKNTN